MKPFFVCVFVLAVASSGLCLSSSEELLQNIKLRMMEDYMKQREISNKVERICPGYGSKTPRVLNQVMDCWAQIDTDQETMCATIKNHLHECAKPMTDLFKDCLPEESNDIPEFVIDSLTSASNYLCKTDGEHIFELYNPCGRTPNYRTSRCLRRIESKLQQYANKYPTKDDICDLSKSMRGCLESHLSASCGQKTTRDAYLGFYDALFSECENDSLALNGIETLDLGNDKLVQYQ